MRFKGLIYKDGGNGSVCSGCTSRWQTGVVGDIPLVGGHLCLFSDQLVNLVDRREAAIISCL